MNPQKIANKIAHTLAQSGGVAKTRVGHAGLTEKSIRLAEPRAKRYELRDERGLFLLVAPTGAKWWRFDYRLHGKRSLVSLGTYPDVTLKEARDRRDVMRTHVEAGRDPAVILRSEVLHARVASVQTVEAVTREWLTRQQKVFAPSTMKRITYMFEEYLFPALGDRRLDAVTPGDLLAMLQQIEARGRLETMHRLKQLTGQVMRYGIVTGRATYDHTQGLRGALLPVKPKHYAALTHPPDVGSLLSAIDRMAVGSVIVRTALQFTALVFVRPGELRLMTWGEVDLAARRWIIPAARMKMRMDHIVPLSRQAVALLQRMEAITGTDPRAYVFPTVRQKSRPMSNMTLAAVLRRLGYGPEDHTVHGFRATARTLLHEQLSVNPEWIELQLAHRTPGALGATYNRGLFLAQRTEMMQQWADYLDTLRTVKFKRVK